MFFRINTAKWLSIKLFFINTLLFQCGIGIYLFWIFIFPFDKLNPVFLNLNIKMWS